MDFFKFFKSDSSGLQPNELEFLRKRKEIIKQLKAAHTKRTIVGITAPCLGQGMFLVGVEGLHQDDQVVDLCPYDMTGTLLEVSRVEISGIKSVCAFNAPYKNPLLSNALASQR